MSDVIRLLPDSVANQIAAGEVIQRPASVVKELVENAVDAGADSIQIIIKDAGRTLIQVVDNGRGMSPTDARMAFERHATSKILDAKDLFALRTMGFRGEALASICAVAQVELRTLAKGENVGTRLIINGSEVESQQPDACTQGTNMMVRNLFYNIPARRKFLKKDSVEMSNILREFERLALVNPGLEFSLVHNDVTLHSLTRGPIIQRIGQLFGRQIEKQLLPIKAETSIVNITGFVGLPENARRRGAQQFLFVNGRHMRHPYFHKAVMSCYERLISPDVQPVYFLYFDVDPATIDVNIHPTKNEIKFENEQMIWQILVAAIRDTLGRFNAMPAIDFENTDAPDIPVFNPDASAAPSLDIDTSYNPFAPAQTSRSASRSGASFSWQRQAGNATSDWEKLYRGFTAERSSETDTAATPDLTTDTDTREASRINSLLSDTDDTVSIPTLLQVKNRYIVSSAKSGLMIIDQQRAHTRILYERFIKIARSTTGGTSQQVMFPEVMQLSPAQDVVISSIVTDLEHIGYNIGSLGDGAWSINGVPPAVSDLNPVDTLTGIIEDVAQDTGDKAADNIAHQVALSMARTASIKSGQPLTPAEMERIVADLMALSTPNYTPDGLTVLKLLTIEDLAALF